MGARQGCDDEDKALGKVEPPVEAPRASTQVEMVELRPTAAECCYQEKAGCGSGEGEEC